MGDKIAARIVRLQRKRGIGRLAREFLALWSVGIPREVEIGRDFLLQHRGHGTVINGNTVIGDHVTIYHNVTIARSDSWVPVGDRTFRPAVIEDDAVLCPGAVILSGRDGITVGRGTIIAANATLTTSTGEWEIWAGSPAKRVNVRKVNEHERNGLATSKKGLAIP